jgi:hypothetical protein
MNLTQINFLNNDIPDYPNFDSDSDSQEETSTEEQVTAETTQDIVGSFSKSNQGTRTPPT